MIVVLAEPSHLPQWAEMRISLWTWDTVEDDAEEAEKLYLSGDPDRAAFVALDVDGTLNGFAEAALRRDYVEGCDTTPVAFLEGVYVRPEWRKRGIARALSDTVGAWGRSRGATEYASNALLENTESHIFHAAIDFVETERVVFFKRALSRNSLDLG